MRDAERAEMEAWLRAGARTYWRPSGRLALHWYGPTPDGWPGPLVLAHLLPPADVVAVADRPADLLALLPESMLSEARQLLRMAAAGHHQPEHGPRPWPPRVRLERMAG